MKNVCDVIACQKIYKKNLKKITKFTKKNLKKFQNLQKNQKKKKNPSVLSKLLSRKVCTVKNTVP